MVKFSEITHPLVREGKGRDKRYLSSLATDYVKVDERQLEDLLEFLYRFSKEVYYYDENLSREAWTDFFVKSIPFQIALIGKFNVEKSWEDYFKISRNSFEKLLGSQVGLVLERIFRLAYQIDLWYADLANDQSGFKTIIGNIISTNLKHALLTLIGYANTYSNAGEQAGPNKKYQQFFQKEIWGLSFADAYKKNDVDLEKKITEEVHKKIDDLFLVFWKSMGEIVNQASQYLEKSIISSTTQDHQPHIGLLLAFLRLFQFVQDDLNRFTSRHLNFYYRDVLRLLELDYVPDKAHLIFQLSKPVNELLLPAGTLFKAGKDTNGEPINFSLEEDTFISKASIAALKTLFIDEVHKTDPLGETETLIKGVYKTPKANSADGVEEAFTDQDPPAWATLGAKESKFTQEDGTVKPHPFANIGLIIGSPMLYLPEGKRKLTLRLNLKIAEGKEQRFVENIEAIKKQVDTSLWFTAEVVNALKEKDLSPQAVSYLNQKEGSVLVAKENEIDFVLLLERDYKETFEVPKSTLTDTDLNLILEMVERRHGFNLFLSGEKEWLQPYEVVTKMLITKDDQGVYKPSFQLVFYIILAEDYDSVEFYNAANFGMDFGTSDPLLKLLLNHQQNIEDPVEGEISLYNYFRYAGITDTLLSMEVCGVSNLVVQNDSGLQDPAKKFQPFGTIPKVGSKFYIGSKEVFKKKFSTVRLNIHWENKPVDFGEYYAVYNGNNNNITFKAKAKLLTNKKWEDAGEVNDVFTSQTKPGAIGCITPQDRISIDLENVGQALTLNQNSEVLFWDQASVDGFLQLELSEKDFKHSQYSAVFSKQFQAQAASVAAPPQFLNGAVYKKVKNEAGCADYNRAPFMCGESQPSIENWEAPLPNEPYTPEINGFSIDYTAKAEAKNLKLIHLYPFEGTFLKQPTLKNSSVLPLHKEEGTLFIGLENLVPGNNLNLYFKVAESTANPEVERAEVSWSYLSSNEWKPLRPDFEVLKDETNGLIGSGIVQLAIPFSINTDNTIMPSGAYWIKASVDKNIQAISHSLLVAAQGGKVVFQSGLNSNLQRLSENLPAGSITKLVQENAQIKGIKQPYKTFGGRAPEKSADFDLRVSERLRHKGRAINVFDYERIILQNFPEVYKVKCITHTLGLKGKLRDYEVAPGFVTVAVIPDLNLVEGANRYEPQLPLNKLETIKIFLKKRISPFIRLTVINPRYELVDVKGEVRFYKGKSVNYYLNLLKEDVKNFMAPWAFGDQSSISFGGKLFQSTILNFIEGLSYIDYVKNFSIKSQVATSLDLEQSEEITPLTARSILVSGILEFMAIEEECCTKGNDQNNKMKGIGYTKIR